MKFSADKYIGQSTTTSITVYFKLALTTQKISSGGTGEFSSLLRTGQKKNGNSQLCSAEIVNERAPFCPYQSIAPDIPNVRRGLH